jgi:hypothetical protein
MSGSTLIRINIKDDRQQSMKGRRFSDIPSNPGTVSWILTRPSATGQMADIVKFLNARNSARESREARPTEAARSMRAVYMLSDGEHGERTVVDAAAFSEIVKRKGIAGGAAGGLRCEHGHVMKFVDGHMSKGSAVRAYFAHVTKSDGAGAPLAPIVGGVGQPTQRTGRCSDVHLAAQLLIKNNISRIVATRFKSCGECTEIAFPPSARGLLPALRAEIEVSERTSDGRMIRSDVVVYRNNERLVSFEVKHTHATGQDSRAMLPYLEVNAGHVVSQFETSASTATVRLKCENATTPCTSGCDARHAASRSHRAIGEAREPAVIERVRAMVDVEYAKLRRMQDALDATPTTPAKIRALLEEMAAPHANEPETAFCFYYPYPYPNGKAHYDTWASIVTGRWGDMAKSMAEEHEARDFEMRRSKVDAQIAAISDWVWSKYELARDEPASGDAGRISFDAMYDLYTGSKPVCRSVTRAFFAKSVFYTTAQCPHMTEAGEFCYKTSAWSQIDPDTSDH